MKFQNPSPETLRKLIEIEWQDHFQTRWQTWKALEITVVLAVALVGLDWRFSNPADPGKPAATNSLVTILAGLMLMGVALFGFLITLRHRNKVEVPKFEAIAAFEKELGVDMELPLPKPIHWWNIFLIWQTNTPLFLLRMHFVIMLFALVYVILRLQ